MNSIPVQDLAMLKLKHALSPETAIPLCSDEEAKAGDILGVCGMGVSSTQKSLKIFPGTF